MGDVAERIRRDLERRFGRRRVVSTGGVLVGMAPLVAELRAVGAARMLLVGSKLGTGVIPEGDDIEIAAIDLPRYRSATDGFRVEERFFAQPPTEVVDRVAAFIGAAEPIVLGQAFSAVRALGPFPIYGARRAEWVALEDKTKCDELFDACGVPRPRGAIVAVDAGALDAASRALDDGAGVVWAGDARDGFNGGAEFVRWVRDSSTRDDALDFFRTRCDRVRVAPFVDGVPCSIHGVVTDDGVAVLRPVELISLRTDDTRGFRYAGVNTYYDPPAAARAVMVAAARNLGALLRERVGFRAAFTIDGICRGEEWLATECNPRAGAGLGYVGRVAPELPIGVAQRALAEDALRVDTGELEAYVVARADAQRWGGAWIPTSVPHTETQTIRVVGDQNGFRPALDGETADGTIMVGPSAIGGFVRFDPVFERTPVGPSLVPYAIAAFKCADEHLGAQLGSFH